jgi:carbonic anhydrase/acetyltransferase-like protein (isoleucine patch superfamily)
VSAGLFKTFCNERIDKMITKSRTMIGIAIVFAMGVLCGALFVLDAKETAAQDNGNINIHPTADVHPSVILEGKVTIGAYTRVSAGCVLTGNITVGHHSLIRCNTVIRGRNTIGNYTNIYDMVNIEGGRPAKVGSSTAEVPDQSIIGDNCWINHGATMHGTQIADGGAVGLNACCDYNTRIGKGAILANGSATHIDQVIPDNAFAEGVPAVIKKENITEEDRLEYFGLSPLGWTQHEGQNQEAAIRKKKGIVD